MNKKDGQAIQGLIRGELARGPYAGIPMPDHLYEVLHQWWPDNCFETSQGVVVMAEADAKLMERLFELFGVPMKVSENSLNVLSNAFDLFVLHLETYVGERLAHPHLFSRFVHDWPKAWHDYIDAVATENTAKAKRLAKKLKVLSPDCKYPPDVNFRFKPSDSVPA